MLTWRLCDIHFHSSLIVNCLIRDYFLSLQIWKKKSHLILFLFWMLQWNLVGILVFYLFLTSLLIKVMCFCFLLTQQAYVSSGHQMAPPSPNTNSSSNSSGGGGEQLSKTNLYIRGLHPGTTDQDLVKLCQPWVRLNVFT